MQAPRSRLLEPVRVAARRLLDVTVAAALLVLLSPVLALIAVAVRLESAGPVLYRCRRAGIRGRAFDMVKFRKMAPDASAPRLTTADDDRFTRVGAVLARSKLDELPQLWNVVKGDMSLVGPRPEDFAFVAQAPSAYEQILRVQPGITGLAQLAFRHEGELLQREDRLTSYIGRIFPAKIQLDRLYIARRSLLLDLRILVWTLAVTILRREVSVDRRTARIALRRRDRNGAHPDARERSSLG